MGASRRPHHRWRLSLLKVFCLIFFLHIEEDVLTFFFYAAGPAGDADATTSSRVEEMVKELTQPERIEVSAAEIPSKGAAVEIGEPSTLPGGETTIEAEEALTLPVEEATAEAGETPILQDSTPLDLEPSKAALTEGAQVGSPTIGTLPEGHTAQFSVEVSEEVCLQLLHWSWKLLQRQRSRKRQWVVLLLLHRRPAWLLCEKTRPISLIP